jgi:predicted membrane protein
MPLSAFPQEMIHEVLIGLQAMIGALILIQPQNMKLKVSISVHTFAGSLIYLNKSKIIAGFFLLNISS